MTKSKAKGTKAETDVVKYLRPWFPLVERRALQGNKDKGDIAGVPLTVVEVKAAETFRLPLWVAETLAERENAGSPLCLLVVKKPYKSVGEWDAYMPLKQLGHPFAEVEARSWVRMDLGQAVRLLLLLIDQAAKALPPSPSGLSYSITELT